MKKAWLGLCLFLVGCEEKIQQAPPVVQQVLPSYTEADRARDNQIYTIVVAILFITALTLLKILWDMFAQRGAIEAEQAQVKKILRKVPVTPEPDDSDVSDAEEVTDEEIEDDRP